MSRSPGIALLYLAKVAKVGIINNASFQEAFSEFEKIYPGINLAGGVRGFLEENAEELLQFFRHDKRYQKKFNHICEWILGNHMNRELYDKEEPAVKVKACGQ